MADDDDWTGEPPEGRHSRDRAKPGYWENQWQAGAAYALLGVFVIVAVVLVVAARLKDRQDGDRRWVVMPYLARGAAHSVVA